MATDLSQHRPDFGHGCAGKRHRYSYTECNGTTEGYGFGRGTHDFAYGNGAGDGSGIGAFTNGSEFGVGHGKPKPRKE